MTLSLTSLSAAEAQLAKLSPVEILRQIHRAFGSRAAILSSMQRAGTMLCHMADRAGLGFDVVFVDTGVLHAETLATRDRLAETHANLHVVTLHPKATFQEQTAKEGLLYLSKEGQERCCDLRKSEPLEAIVGQYDVLIGALRRDEGGRRAATRFIDLDPRLGVVRIHPLAAMTRADIDAYITAHRDVVVNPLHYLGFPTIGCFPCTTPVRPDEDERAGRWRHLADVAYCGINPTDRGDTERTTTLPEGGEARFRAFERGLLEGGNGAPQPSRPTAS
ncbi:MAG: phosphoadenylyl-sulfate reductase [Polyangiaceae bacterium]|nr:phosphoadenylyl-sulfate reductase [Polyangiaceae bacterium]